MKRAVCSSRIQARFADVDREGDVYMTQYTYDKVASERCSSLSRPAQPSRDRLSCIAAGNERFT